MHSQIILTCPLCKYENKNREFIPILPAPLTYADIYGGENKDELSTFACPKCGIVFIHNWRVSK